MADNKDKKVLNVPHRSLYFSNYRDLSLNEQHE